MNSVFIYLKISLFCLHLWRMFLQDIKLYFHFSTLKILFHCLLTWFLLMKSQTQFLSNFPLNVSISLGALKILSLVFINLFTLCPDVGERRLHLFCLGIVELLSYVNPHASFSLLYFWDSNYMYDGPLDTLA